MGKKEKKLFANTAFLYLMTISTQLLNIITVPYLTRVLGPTIYGRIGLAQGYMAYVQIILDFGFMLSATRIVSENRKDNMLLSKVVSEVSVIKFILTFAIAIVFVILYWTKFFDEEVVGIICVYMLAYLFNALIPDYFYRGIEDMKVISIRSVLIKAFFTGLIFLLVKSSEDYMYVPISYLLGAVVALLFSIVDIVKRYKIRFCWVHVSGVVSMFKETFQFFVSRFASTFYQTLNIVILGKIYGDSPLLGYYSTSDKIVALSKTGSAPIADSLYPYMISNKNYKLVKKILAIFMPIIILFVVMLAVYAEPICAFAFGREYYEAGKILRILLPIILVILPTYIIAFPVMAPLGLTKYANMSNVVGMVIQLSGLVVLRIFDLLDIYYICGLISFTEVSVFIFRCSVVIIHVYKKKAQV
jgi:PST family polysaccharide transporter